MPNSTPRAHAERDTDHHQRQGQHGAVPLVEQCNVEEAEPADERHAPTADGMANDRSGAGDAEPGKSAGRQRHQW